MSLFNSGRNTLLFLLIQYPIIGSGFSLNKELKEKQKKPNVLILFADQHNKNVMGFEGHPDVLTPNLDKLAKQSVVFDRAYCVTNDRTLSKNNGLIIEWGENFGDK